MKDGLDWLGFAAVIGALLAVGMRRSRQAKAFLLAGVGHQRLLTAALAGLSWLGPTCSWTTSWRK
jgi:hypothetical protein